MKILNSQLKKEGYRVVDFISGGAQGRVYKLIDASHNLATIKIQSIDENFIDREIDIIHELHTRMDHDYKNL